MVVEAAKVESSIIGCKMYRKRKPSSNLQKIRKQTETKIIYLKAIESKYVKNIKRNKQKQILEDAAQ